MNLWFKVGTLQREMEQEDKAFMEKNSRTRISGGAKLTRMALPVWQIVGKIQTPVSEFVW